VLQILIRKYNNTLNVNWDLFPEGFAGEQRRKRGKIDFVGPISAEIILIVPTHQTHSEPRERQYSLG
jgi:hypothetical protein